MSARYDTGHADKKVMPGAYSAKVEYINDPTQTGRIKVRIPVLYGMPSDTKTENLPWARPCLPFGGGHDYGAYAIPPVGSTVWVIFEGGNIEYPIWIGTWPGIPTEPQTMLRDSNKKLPERPVSMSPDLNTTWQSAPGPDGPVEGLIQVDSRPERYVVFKSPKGAAVLIEDRDEAEFLQIVDRGGQNLTFNSPVKSSENLKNAAARGGRTSLNGDPVPMDSTLAEEASVLLIDQAGQHLELLASKNGNRVRLVSKPTGENKEIDATSVTLELDSSRSRACITVMKDGLVKAQIEVDGETESIRLNAPNGISISTTNLDIQGNLNVLGDIIAHGDSSTMGEGFFGKDLSSVRDGSTKPLAAVALPQV